MCSTSMEFFEEDKWITKRLKQYLAWYIEKHPYALTLGGEYIMQDDKAQEDAIQLVCDIFDNWE